MLMEGEASIPEGPRRWLGVFLCLSSLGEAMKYLVWVFLVLPPEVIILFYGVESGRENALGVLEKSLIMGRSNTLFLDPLSSEMGGLIALLGVGAFE